jgi:hypothetical protein
MFTKRQTAHNLQYISSYFNIHWHPLTKFHSQFVQLLQRILAFMNFLFYRGADKSLAPPTSRYIFFVVRIFRLMLVLLYIYIYITNIPPVVIINRIYENQNLLSL